MTITEINTVPATGIPPGKSMGASSPHDEPDIPVAFASVLDENRSPTVPAYAASSAAAYDITPTPTPQPTIVQASHTQAAMVVEGQPAATTPRPPDATTPKPTTPNYGPRPIPPNAPPGGQWVSMKYSGNKTWGIIAGTGCCLFWFCFVFTAPLALFGLACPCDERIVYMSPNGVMYNEDGQAVGDRRRNKFRILSKV